MFYHDGRHPHIYRYEPPMQKEEYAACIDELAGTPIEAVMFCLGEGRTMLHDTKAGELLGHNVDSWDHLIFRRAHQNAKHLIDEGHDPLRIVCDRAHEKGILLYPTLIMNAGGPNSVPVRCSNFRKNNPHLEIGAQGDLAPDFDGADNLDFKHKEARDERFAIIEEALTDYPVDGFELQFNHQTPHFHPNEVEAGRKIMTDWIGHVHETLKKSGSDRELAIHIPFKIEDCLSIGLDPEEWVKQGIVDVLIGQPFGHTDFADPMTDFSDLISLANSTDCRIIATLQARIASDRLSDSPTSVARATACNYWDQDIDGIYLSQWFNYWPYQANFYEIMREIPHPDIMASKDKFYYVPTDTERERPRKVSMQLPASLDLNNPVKVQITISDDLPRWDKVNRVHEVILRILIMETTELDQLSFKLNGKELPETLLRKINQMYRMSSPRYRIFGYWFIFRLDSEHWPQKGNNTLEITLLERDPDVTTQIQVRNVELEIKYLMGKNFHRGYVDPDLGPYEHTVS